MKKSVTFAAVAAILFSLPAWAMDLQTARVQGVVGELKTGYVEKLSGGGDVAALVADVNSKRRAEYARISAENGQPVDVVAKLAAPQIIAGLPAGARYQDASGAWQKK